ncbi:hypothetical protein SAM23877_6564 [Streptomyces ambofaciens ATCC 23877]|uniref:Uncharacterized protein n=1 Tax=Streptomyces ambofaciens (strain ATCC 23877 / 3486 / DSM 40053 / JCM 4204 / NBRC 12836 / NRRL B-2516) TaxID=278992 RepID=A0A0K2B2X9_STRA7|nr:hypothetical protein SAM23877_6564 [Streptomyces ambofaciens ATCC 23877]
MISCPAAVGMRWVKPSRPTVAPSCTKAATASLIDMTLPAPTAVCVRSTVLLAECVRSPYRVSGH